MNVKFNGTCGVYAFIVANKITKTSRISDGLGMPVSTVKYNLNKLISYGLIERLGEKQNSRYRIIPMSQLTEAQRATISDVFEIGKDYVKERLKQESKMYERTSKDDQFYSLFPF